MEEARKEEVKKEEEEVKKEEVKKVERVTKNPKRVEAGKKTAALRKARHEEVLQKLRQSKEPKEQESTTPPFYPAYIAVMSVGLALGLGIYYYTRQPTPAPPIRAPPATSTEPDPFKMQ